MSPPVARRRIGFGETTEYVVDNGRDPLPTRAAFFKAMNQVVTERDGEWCGIPVPLPGLGLVLEDRHPHAAKLAELQRITDEDAAAGTIAGGEDVTEWTVANQWRTTRYRGDIPGEVFVLRHQDGRVEHGFLPDAPRRNRMLFGPFDTFEAWDLDTELAAIDRLATLLSTRMFECYVMTGQFLETSKRSGLTYFFRRLKPTIVLTPRGSASTYFKPSVDGFDGAEMRILTCLCLHPLAYYARTFCGAMVPTDDVIAHLLLMRGDEVLFWRRANHHRPTAVESGL